MIRIRAERPVDFDVAIAGAGPAGAGAAFHFARAGYRVALFDQKQFPRDKVCGDFIGPAALAEIDRLGIIGQRVFRDANPIRRAALYLDGVKLIGQSVPRIAGLPDHGLCIPRVVLDESILQAAIAAGASLRLGVRVTGYRNEPGCVVVSTRSERGECPVTARLLIGADGSSSQIARLLRGSSPPRRDRILAVRAYFDRVDGPQDQADLYFSGSTFPGYTWVFPTGGASANVGVGMLLETSPPIREPQLAKLLAGTIGSDAAIQFRLSTAEMRGKIAGWPLMTFNPSLPIAGNRVILVGDAAGLINPLNGEGIQYALQSARWAAECLAQPLRRDALSAADLHPFAARVLEEMRFDMAFARMIIDLISNRTFTPIWLKALRIITRRAATDPEYSKITGAILAGIAPARDALSYRVVLGTIQSAITDAAFSLGVDALRGPARLWETGMELGASPPVLPLIRRSIQQAHWPGGSTAFSAPLSSSRKPRLRRFVIQLHAIITN